MGESKKMSTADWIQFGILTIALVALIYQITVQINETKKREKRILTKLIVFYFCQNTPKTESDIINHFIYALDLRVDEFEIKKSIYEMLKDGTLRYRSNNTFKARRNTARDDNEEKVEKENKGEKE